MKSFLFLCESLVTGGIETLLTRMANWLVQENMQVTVLTRHCSDEFKNLLNPGVRLIEHQEYRNFYHTNTPPGCSTFPGVDVIYILSPRDLALGLLIGKNIGPGTKVLYGVYHPASIERERGVFGWKVPFLSYFYRFIADRNGMLFMNQENYLTHYKYFNNKAFDTIIWPLPINIPKPGLRSPVRFKIVSVGNLKQFKSYNLSMIPKVRELVDHGFDVTWDIYGDGPLKGQMEQQIAALALNERVTLHGQCIYTELSAAFDSAFVFIGVGTALLESAAHGVPSIGAIIDSPQPVAYGYIYDLPDANVGEKVPGMTEKPIIGLLEHLFGLSEEDYLGECEKCRNYTQRYALDKLMPDFMGLAAKTKPLAFLNVKIRMNLKLYMFFDRLQTKTGQLLARS